MAKRFHSMRYVYPHFRVVLRKERTGEGDERKWVATALEHFIAASGDSWKDALYNLHMMLAAQVVASRDQGLSDPFADVPTAPDDIWEDYETGIGAIPHEDPWFPAPVIRFGRST